MGSAMNERVASRPSRSCQKRAQVRSDYGAPRKWGFRFSRRQRKRSNQSHRADMRTPAGPTVAAISLLLPTLPLNLAPIVYQPLSNGRSISSRRWADICGLVPNLTATSAVRSRTSRPTQAGSAPSTKSIMAQPRLESWVSSSARHARGPRSVDTDAISDSSALRINLE